MEGRTRSSAAARGEARALVSQRRADAQGKTNRRRREEEERKGAAVFDEEEEEGIDLRQALVLIYQGDLLLVGNTHRE